MNSITFLNVYKKILRVTSYIVWIEIVTKTEEGFTIYLKNYFNGKVVFISKSEESMEHLYIEVSCHTQKMLLGSVYSRTEFEPFLKTLI